MSTGPTDPAFAERLRLLRAARGLTQAELAEKAGVGRRSIEEYERGKLPRKAGPALARALDVTPDLLLRGADPLDVRMEAVARGLYAVEQRLDSLERLLAEAAAANRRIWYSVDATLRLMLAHVASPELLERLPEPPTLDDEPEPDDDDDAVVELAH
jgi:transcriptional regulator with XRE-family HTH domain